MLDLEIIKRRLEDHNRENEWFPWIRDGELMLNAPEDIAELIAEVERLRAIVEDQDA